jgi:intracellular multiplication protein IcmE
VIMFAEKDVSRDAKKTGFIIAAVVFAVAAGGFLLISWLSTPPPAASRISVDKVAGGTGKAASESPHYKEILRAHNAEGAKQAHAANSSFIASIGSGSSKPQPTVEAAPSPPPLPLSDNGARQQQVIVAQGIAPDRQKAIEALLKELVNQRMAPYVQVAGVTGGQAGTGSLYRGWTDSLAPAQIPTNWIENGGRNTDHVVITAGSRIGAVIDTAIDSDNTSSQVLAGIPSGPYAGAMLMANGVQLAGDGVSIHFTRMTLGKDTWRVDVWAAMPDTLQSSVASSINNRYGTRILLPALAHGLGLGGQLYASANTQILSNGFNTIEGRVGMPSGTAIAGTVLGGAAQQAGQVISSDAQKLPVKQVLVLRGQAVALLFMSAVKESDKETNTNDSPQSQPERSQTPARYP